MIETRNAVKSFLPCFLWYFCNEFIPHVELCEKRPAKRGVYYKRKLETYRSRFKRAMDRMGVFVGEKQ